MVIGIVSDAHGNLYGLERMVSLLEKHNVEKLYFLGDAINYFGKGKAVLNFLRDKKICCIKGNHELMLLENRKLSDEERDIYGIDYTRSILDAEDYAFINSWHESIEIRVDGLRILMVHGNPNDHYWGYTYPDGSFDEFAQLPYEGFFTGHTHIPFIQEIHNKIIVNVGSSGLPRSDGRYINGALFDIRKRKVEILKEDFPYERMTDLRPFSPVILSVLERRNEVD